MSRFKKLLVAIAVVAMAVPAFSAVENVKVGGDMDVEMIYRNNIGFIEDMSESFTYMGTRVYVQASLTDNVEAMVRLINERDFGNDYLRDIEGSVLLDLAYIKVADLFTPGLTLTLGRQELQLGDGLVVGSRYRALDYLAVDLGSTAATDYGKQKAFDTIRLDYAFPTVDVSATFFKAKILETYALEDLGDLLGVDINVDDVDLYGLGVTYSQDRFSIEPYLVYVRMPDELDLYTAAIKADVTAMEGLQINAELAKQFGDTGDLLGDGDFEGWAGMLGLEYKMNTNMEPTISAAYHYFSGDAGDVEEMWMPVFPSDIASRVGKVAYPTIFAAGEGVYANAGLIAAASGLHSFKLGGSIKPAENIKLGLDWFHLRAVDTISGIDEVLGNELDFSMNYQYTEDLSFGLDAGILLAGDMVDDAGLDDENPWQVIVSTKLAF